MKASAILLTLGLSAACQHMDRNSDTAAVLVNPTASVQAQLLAALTQALGQAPRALADDALTTSSVLLIERAALSNSANPALTGRTLEASAQRFVLVRARGQCVLTRPADGWRQRLALADCIAESAPR